MLAYIISPRENLVPSLVFHLNVHMVRADIHTISVAQYYNHSSALLIVSLLQLCFLFYNKALLSFHNLSSACGFSSAADTLITAMLFGTKILALLSISRLQFCYLSSILSCINRSTDNSLMLQFC